MSEKNNKNKITNFRTNRVSKLRQIYSDDISTKRKYGISLDTSFGRVKDAAGVRKALKEAIQNKKDIVDISRKLYSTNPIYATVIDYLSDLFMWRYKVTPHKVYKKSAAKAKKKMKPDDFQLMYSLMLEVVDGLGIENKFPSLLSLLFTQGSVFFTTYCDQESISIDTILLPNNFCRSIGETQFGSLIIQFDYSYFDTLSLNDKDLKEFLKTFPAEFSTGYKKFLKDQNTYRWQTLTPTFSSGLRMNEYGIPAFFYIYGSLLDYERYQDNELERSDNLLKYLVVHTMPVYEDKLVFEVDEVEAIHQSLRRIVDTGDKARLITTFGDVHVDKIAENDNSTNEVLARSFEAVFNNAGFNSAIFASESVQGILTSLIRDKSKVWKYVQGLLNFYTIAINNWFDFKEYQADIDILPISLYTYNDDIDIYRENATLGVGKLDYVIASGIKQKTIQDQFDLEDFLKLNEITPMQTSYTQTAEDRADGDKPESEDEKLKNSDDKSKKDKSGNEPTDEDEVVDKSDSDDKKDSTDSENEDK